MKPFSLPLLLTGLSLTVGILLSCSTPATPQLSSITPTPTTTAPPLQLSPPVSTPRQTKKSPKVSITEAFIPAGQFGRRQMRKMKPRYITIHSTQNTSAGAGARTHARLLQRGGLTATHNSLGYLTWHFSVDDHSVYQTLPTNEQGQHADYEGPGNRLSIGIEMCENAGNSRAGTLDRTARLCAQLMKEHRIPLRNIVPHQHWERIRYSDRRNLGHKNCPHFLMTDGRPGAKWQAFQRQIQSYL